MSLLLVVKEDEESSIPDCFRFFTSRLSFSDADDVNTGDDWRADGDDHGSSFTDGRGDDEGSDPLRTKQLR